MEFLYDWVKNIIYFMIFLSVAANLLADTKYEQYIRFFAGVLLILLTVRPILGGLGLEGQIEKLFERFSMEMEVEELKEEMWAMDGQRREMILAQYREAVERDIGEMAAATGLDCRSVEAVFWEEGENWGQVRRVTLYLSDGEEKAVEAGIRIEPVQVGGEDRMKDAGRETMSGEGRADTRDADGLKGKVALYYGLEEADIEIVGQDD